MFLMYIITDFKYNIYNMINNTEYKTCNICGLIKKHNEFYNTDTRCKICKSEYQK